MKKLLWTNTSLSGLCDRLLDIFLMAAYSKVIGAELYITWKENTNYTERQLQIWPKARFDDYKYENLSDYFKLPDFVHVINDSGPAGAVVFNDYLGGIYSLVTFHNKYCRDICSLEHYIDTFYKIISEFKPTDKLIWLTKTIPVPDIAVHLRRTDKITNTPDAGQTNDLEKLNSLTINAINSIIKENSSIFFCSDEENTKNQFKEIYKNYKIIDLDVFSDLKRTYIDMYILSVSNTIIMSQKHSNFSLFCSQINQKNLIYLFPDNPLVPGGGFRNTKLISL